MVGFSVVSGFLLRPIMSFDPRKTRKDAARYLKSRFDPDHVFLARDEDHLLRRDRSEARESDRTTAGATPAKGDAKPVAWREWAWTSECAVGHCTFREVRWRFYSNGRIAFQATMENAGSNIRIGNLQGQRIELRTSDGGLLGAWKAAFFVRRYSSVVNYPATILDEHPLVPLHFEDLAETQTGLYYFS